MRKRIGNRLNAALTAVVTMVFVSAPFSLTAGLFSLASGQDQTESSYAMVAGTVFRDPGFALPGATVTLMLRDDPKHRKMQAVTTARGEFSFRVGARYLRAKGVAKRVSTR